MTKERVADLRALRMRLKSGEYDGADVMAAWIAIAEYADLLDKRANCAECERLLVLLYRARTQLNDGTREGQEAMAALITRDAFTARPDEPSAHRLDRAGDCRNPGCTYPSVKNMDPNRCDGAGDKSPAGSKPTAVYKCRHGTVHSCSACHWEATYPPGKS